jgi:beta-glucosidase
MTTVEQLAAPRVLTFPTGFRWGAATAAYQIEGAANEDGRRPSIWDTFAATPGKVFRGHTGDVACDHYHLYPRDIALMSELGLGTYRMSVAWPRVKPDGSGPVNRRGLDFYDRVLDELLAYGIDPMVTLYHWDLPQTLEDGGGWTNRDTALYFADYTSAVVASLGDRVSTWTTINEPWCAAFLGYGSGDHAPGRRDPAAAYAAAHHLLLGHGLAAQVLRAAGVPEISISQLLTRVSLRDPDKDAAAARLIDALQNRMWLDPVLRGEYPTEVLGLFERFGVDDVIRPGDLATISTPIDLLGVNYYQPALVGADVGNPGSPVYPGTEGVALLPQDLPVTGMDWPVDASGLSDMLIRVATDYPGTPVMITENGSSYVDRLAGDDVHDAARIAYFDGHLRAAHFAISAGVDVRGYVAWSLLDNFEWAYGYAKRFGLFHVDYETQQRTWKDSAHWYRGVIAANGVAPESV